MAEQPQPIDFEASLSQLESLVEKLENSYGNFMEEFSSILQRQSMVAPVSGTQG